MSAAQRGWRRLPHRPTWSGVLAEYAPCIGCAMHRLGHAPCIGCDMRHASVVTCAMHRLRHAPCIGCDLHNASVGSCAIHRLRHAPCIGWHAPCIGCTMCHASVATCTMDCVMYLRWVAPLFHDVLKPRVAPLLTKGHGKCVARSYIDITLHTGYVNIFNINNFLPLLLAFNSAFHS